MRKQEMNPQVIAAISAKRGQIYRTFITIFTCLPDDAFWNYIHSEELGEFLKQHEALQYSIITKGIQQISGYLENSVTEKDRQIEALAVDRTNLFRVPPNTTGFKLPYEGQYQKEMKSSSSLLRLTNAYKKAGFVPMGKESLDFFCVELDFMRMLSQRIAENPAEAQPVLSLQKNFLEAHLGKWICIYTEEAAPHAHTDFYRGWLMMLQGFIEIEKNYLQSI